MFLERLELWLEDLPSVSPLKALLYLSVIVAAASGAMMLHVHALHPLLGGYTKLFYIALFAAILFMMSRAFGHETPRQSRLRERMNAALTPEQVLEWDQVLTDAKARLEKKDRDFLKTMLVYMSDAVETTDEGVYFAGATNGNFVCICPAIMMKQVPDLDFEKAVDWTRRILLHEIGHARDGYTDEYMAREFGY